MWGKNVKPFTNLWWTEFFSARVKDSQYAPQVGLSDLYSFLTLSLVYTIMSMVNHPFIIESIPTIYIDGVNVRVEIKSLDKKVMQGKQWKNGIV